VVIAILERIGTAKSLPVLDSLAFRGHTIEVRKAKQAIQARGAG
jgi:hypothetical protein